MTARIIDGKAAAAKLRSRIAEETARLKAAHGVVPGLAVVLVGDDPASDVYVRSKGNDARECGFEAREFRLSGETPEADLLARVQALNADPAVHGILVQFPVPAHIRQDAILDAIDPAKDVDGLTPTSAGLLASGRAKLVSCTPLGVTMLISDTLGDIAGADALVIGRSILVGKPMAQLLLAANATVTIAHSRTRDLPGHARRADILVAALGRAQFVKGDWIKPGACVIDVGTTRIDLGEGRTRLVGDVDFAAAREIAGAITPVPGGVGPMTRACLMRNTLVAAALQMGLPIPDVLAMTAAPAHTDSAGELRSWRRIWPYTSFFGGSQAARGRVRLRTLSNLRWLAIGGQAAALFVVHFGLEYRLPLTGCLVAIVSSAALNTWFAFRFPATHRLTNRDATVFLAFDVMQLGALLYLTGGIENPFALMFLAPVVIAAATLNLGNTLLLAALALASVSVIALVHYPLPWIPGQHLDLPPLYQGGIWASLVIGIGFTSIYAWRIASEASRMQAGLAATQLALAREHRLGSLGALAAAAAHELGTPLGTIAVAARELERALPPHSPEAEDARLLRAEAERCRGILTRLARPEESVLGKPERLPLGALLDEIAGEHRGGDILIDIHLPESTRSPEPKVWRIPELLHGLGNLLANAADFARTKVGVGAEWNMREICLFVEDDGPGFDPEILERIGEPYVTSRPGSYALGHTELGPTDAFEGQHGMGLGFFIAKTLVEQTGGSVKARNREEGGARIVLRWPRGGIDGENPPGQVEAF